MPKAAPSVGKLPQRFPPLGVTAPSMLTRVQQLIVGGGILSQNLSRSCGEFGGARFELVRCEHEEWGKGPIYSILLSEMVNLS